MKLLIASDIHGAAAIAEHSPGRLGPRGRRPPAAAGRPALPRPAQRPAAPATRRRRSSPLLNGAEAAAVLRARQLRHRGGPDGAGIPGAGRLLRSCTAGEPPGLRDPRPRPQ